MTMPRVVLFGGGGLLGGAIASALDDRRLGMIAPPRVALDITDGRGLRAALGVMKPKLIINTAAFTDVDGAEDDPSTARRINADGAEILAREAGRVGAVLLHISTDFVFDGSARRPYGEDDAVAPQSTYGATKAAGEARIREVLHRHVILRTAWLHGAGRACFVRTITERLMAGQEVSVLSDRLASPTSTIDLAHQIAALARRIVDGEDVAYGTYHLAGEGGSSPYDIAQAIARCLGAPSELVHPDTSANRSEKAKRPDFAVLDTSRARTVLGLELPSWRSGIERTVKAIAHERRWAA